MEPVVPRAFWGVVSLPVVLEPFLGLRFHFGWGQLSADNPPDMLWATPVGGFPPGVAPVLMTVYTSSVGFCSAMAFCLVLLRRLDS